MSESSKKRASAGGHSTRSKRQKSGDVSSTMTVSKSTISANKVTKVQLGSERFTSSEGVPSQSRPSATSHRETPDTMHDITYRTAPVSLYAPPTSMTNLMPVSQTTSLGQLKTLCRHGHAVYRDLPPPSLQQTGNDTPCIQRNTAAAETARQDLRFRDPQDLPSPTRSVANNGNDPDVALRPSYEAPKGRLDGGKPKIVTAQGNLPHGLSVVSTGISFPPQNSSGDEDFFSSDDDSNEQALDYAQSLQAVVKISSTDTKESVRIRQLTPRTSPASCIGRLDKVSISGAITQSVGGDRNDSDEFDVGIVDENILADLVDEQERLTALRPRTPPPRTAKQNAREVDSDEDYGGALLSRHERNLLDQVVSRLPQQDPKPIQRTPFPSPVLDRSPIFGASDSTMLRTCFHVGEAYNVGCHSVRTNKPLILELYARVARSWREDTPSRKQHFIFRDLYHDRPPHIDGTFELWDQSRLWDADSKHFLKATENGGMCRTIARMRRDGRCWRLEVLGIWESTLHDVEHVAGIYARDTTRIRS